MLTSLATELIQDLGTKLDISDVIALRKTCKALGRALALEVLRTFTIDLRGPKMQPTLNRLECLASGSHPASQAIRELLVKSFSPIETYAFFHRFRDNAINSPAETLVETRLRAHLSNAIASLKAVTVVRWTPNKMDSKESQESFVGAISALPTLQSLHVSLANCKVPIPFDDFPPLRQLSIFELPNTDDGDIELEKISKLVGRSPRLSHLAIEVDQLHGNVDGPSKPRRSLQYLFSSIPPTSDAFSIYTLSLRGLNIQLGYDPQIIRHLRYLTTLSLSSVGGHDALSRHGHLEEDNESSDEGTPNYHGFWSSLSKEGIVLHDITTDRSTDGLLDYLESYRGLKRLVLRMASYDEHAHGLAHRFLSTSLKPHLSTIEDLQVAPLFDGVWCLDPSFISAIEKCESLRFLRVTLAPTSLCNDCDPKGDSAPENLVKALLQSIIVCLPALQKVEVVAPSKYPSHWNAPEYRAPINQFNNSIKRISQVLRNFQVPCLSLKADSHFEVVVKGNNAFGPMSLASRVIKRS